MTGTGRGSVDEFEAELKDARQVALGRDDSELGTAEGLGWRREAGRVGDVERFGTELQSETFEQLGVLRRGQIDLAGGVAAAAVECAGGVAEGVGGRDGEWRGIDPALRSGVGDAGLPAIPVRALPSALRESVVDLRGNPERAAGEG